MPSAVQRGNYFVLRTRKWLESRGYEVGKVEQLSRFVKKTRDEATGVITEEVRWSKRDLWGADLVARNRDRLLWIQVKSCAEDVTKGMKALGRGPWPKSKEIELWVVWWPLRRRSALGPIIEVVEIGEVEE